MIVERIWTANSLRNWNYLIVCPESGEALAVDPLAHEACLERARERGFQITQVLNAHEHHDHIGGNDAVIAKTGARLLAHHGAKNSISGLDRGLSAGDVVRVGKTVELSVLDTPGHTMSHICLLSRTETPGLFSGDTLFNAGVGNCHNGGHPEQLYESFSNQLTKLPDSTRVYPGHDYIENNLKYTLDREPDNEAAGSLLGSVATDEAKRDFVATLGLERRVNTFFRLQSPSVIARLREAFPDLPDQPDERTVFLKLRELRNRW
jgi:hydroxyacylglutathione hydrolase